MINILELTQKVKAEGYTNEMVDAKVCQDIILQMISLSRFKDYVTIKGGLVIRSLSHNIRRATIDIDFDFIHYPLSESGIFSLLQELSGIEGISIKINGNIVDLKHKVYQGKRVNIILQDAYENVAQTKMDIGVHKYVQLAQDKHCFEISSSKEGAILLINSLEQIIAEKIKSLLRFGTYSTRFKDVFDICYLIHFIDERKLIKAFEFIIFKDTMMSEKNINNIYTTLKTIFNDETYINKLKSSKKNWLNKDVDKVTQEILISLKNIR